MIPRTPRFPTPNRLMIALCLAGASLGASTSSFADSSRQPSITEVRADGGTLHILGLNLDGRAPKVSLGGMTLSVTSVAGTQVVAVMPAGVAPGSYLLTLTLGKSPKDDRDGNDDNSRYDEFWVTIGALGPAGPVGPAGAAGATGQQGLAGPAGVAGPQGPVGATGPQGLAGPQGPAGTGGAVQGLASLVGLPCTVGTCSAVTSITIDPATYAVNLACRPNMRTLTVTGVSNGLAGNEGMSIDIDPNGILDFPSLYPGYNTPPRSGTVCDGQLVTVTINRGRMSSSSYSGGSVITVSGPGTCSSLAVPVSNETTSNIRVTCQFTMDANHAVAVQ